MQPYEAVAEQVRSLGNRLELSDSTFPVAELVPMLKRYSYQYQRNSPESWVMDVFLDLGVPHETIFGILQNMLYNDEPPFQGSNRSYIANDLLYLAEKWLNSTRTVAPYGNDANATEVLQTLQYMMSSRMVSGERMDRCQDLNARISQLLR
jgi:nuclear pore complex protein Nup155